MSSPNGKGSTPRPLSVPKKEFDNNFDSIFKKPAQSQDFEPEDSKGLELPSVILEKGYKHLSTWFNRGRGTPKRKP